MSACTDPDRTAGGSVPDEAADQGEAAGPVPGGLSAAGIAAEMRRRAEALAAPLAADDEEERTNLLVFVRGDAVYALDVAATAAVTPIRQVVALPGVGDVHLGLVVHRGQVHALVDLNALLERRSEQALAPAFAILLDDPDCAVALAADAIRGTRAESTRLVQSASPRSSIVRSVLPDGTSVISVDAVTGNARLVVDHRPQVVSPA